MQTSTGNYEKTILILATVVAIAVAAYLVVLSKGFEEGLVLETVAPKNQMNPPNTKAVSDAIATISKSYSWASPVIKGKAVPLNKSILLIRKDSEIFDIYTNDSTFRPPMDNKFIVGDAQKGEEPLPHLLSPNLGQLDADDDGFSNEEEFKAGTSPRDAKSMPPFTNKLYLKKRIANDYILQFNMADVGATGATFQIKRMSPEPARNVFATPNKEFGFDPGVNRFVIQSYAPKKIVHPKFGPMDAFVLKIKDLATQQEFELELKGEKNLAEYEAQFEFRWQNLQIIPNVKKGKMFQLPGLGKSFIVKEIEETKAIIAPVEAPEKTIEIHQN